VQAGYRRAVVLVQAFGDLLGVLEDDRRAHSLAVGRKAEAAAVGVAAPLRAELVVAAVLHDIGYGHLDTGLHALDGARFLAEFGFSRVVCNLVAHHTASTFEAEERGIDLSAYAAFAVNQDLGEAHAVLWWADMTTGPQGQDVTVEDRLDEICARYGPDDLVTRFIGRARPVLLAAGQSPVGSIQVRC
jgi:putative nucleotidyltransferase with HDIG domain